jgi:hypothetical protein
MEKCSATERPEGTAVRWDDGSLELAIRDSCGIVTFMSSTNTSSVLDGFLEPLSRCLDAESAQRVIDLQIDPAVQARVEVLADRANEGLLTEAERAEYSDIVDAADLVAILKLKVRRQLKLNGA